MNTPDQELTKKFMEGSYSEGVGYDDQAPKFEPIPDTELKSKIMEALNADMHVDATNIIVDVHYGEVLLTGTVSSRQMMNAAKECVEHFMNVKKIDNQLTIQVPE